MPSPCQTADDERFAAFGLHDGPELSLSNLSEQTDDAAIISPAQANAPNASGNAFDTAPGNAFGSSFAEDAPPPFSSPENRRAEDERPQKFARREQTWVILGDVHGDLDKLPLIPELPEADGVIITGDITKLGGVAQARDVIEALQAINPVVLAQIGNMDRPEVNDWLEAEGINLHCKVRELAPDVAVIGVGGSTFTPFGTPSEFPEARFAEWLEALAHRARGYASLVLVTHNPPRDTICDRTSMGTHVGSHALREFLEEHQPEVCLCGHIHEGRGQQLLGRTKVANPGTLAAGGYALLHVADKIRVSLCGLEA